MPLDKQALNANTVLVGTYKKLEHRVLVLGEPGPEQGFELDNGTIYKSLSSAAKAVMGGISANGWRFWSLEGEAQAKRTEKAGKATLSAVVETGAGWKRQLVQIRKLPNQKGAPEGQTRWFCSSCMAAFNATTGIRPEECPEGHPRVTVDDLS